MKFLWDGRGTEDGKSWDEEGESIGEHLCVPPRAQGRWWSIDTFCRSACLARLALVDGPGACDELREWELRGEERVDYLSSRTDVKR